MKEDNILKKKFGSVNHFTVPEGYFDSFADKLMEQLPDTDARVIPMRAATWWHRLPMRKIAVAVGTVVVLACGAAFYANHASSDNASVAHASSEHVQQGGSEYGTFDQMADYTMMDNQDIYVSLVADNVVN